MHALSGRRLRDDLPAVLGARRPERAWARARAAPAALAQHPDRAVQVRLHARHRQRGPAERAQGEHHLPRAREERQVGAPARMRAYFVQNVFFEIGAKFFAMQTTVAGSSARPLANGGQSPCICPVVRFLTPPVQTKSRSKSCTARGGNGNENARNRRVVPDMHVCE